MKFLLCTGLVAFLILSGGVAQATPIMVKFSGVIGGIFDPGGIYENKIQVEDGYVATFVFDSTTPDRLPGDSRFGSYRALSSTIVVGLITFTGTPDEGGLRITNDPSGDSLILGCRATTSPDIGFANLEAAFMDRSATVFSSDSLPLPSTTPPLGAFTEAFFKGESVGNASKFTGTITSLEITPEPGTLYLLLLGAALARRRA